MVILFISAIIGAVIAGLWYSREKQKIRDEYQRQMEQYLAQLEQSQQPQQTVTEEHYMFMFKVPEDKDNERYE